MHNLIKKVKCHYCGNDAELVTGQEIYLNRPDLYTYHYWRCTPCDAYVGCHILDQNHRPYGILANKELRELKIKTHKIFDELGKTSGMNRSQAYKWLAKQLKIRVKYCHIGLFDIDMCNKIIDICLNYKMPQ